MTRAFGRSACGFVHPLLALGTGVSIIVLAVVLFFEKLPNSASLEWPKPIAGVLLFVGVVCLLQTVRLARLYLNPGVLETFGGAVAGLAIGLLLYDFILEPRRVPVFAGFVVKQASYSIALIAVGIAMTGLGCIGTLVGLEAWSEGYTYVPNFVAGIGVVLFYISISISVAANVALSLAATRLYGGAAPLLPVVFAGTVLIVFLAGIRRRKRSNRLSFVRSLLLLLSIVCHAFFFVSSITQMRLPEGWLIFERPIMIYGFGITTFLLLVNSILHLTTAFKHPLREAPRTRPSRFYCDLM